MYHNVKVFDPVKGTKVTQFEYRWGKHINWFVDFESTTPEAIRMRIHKWGNPWMRKPEPTETEKKYQRTLKEIALELNLHPGTVLQRISRNNSIREEDKKYPHKKAWNKHKHSNWQKYTQFGKTKPWVMESAPRYQEWKSGSISWEQYRDYLQSIERCLPDEE